MAEKTDEENKTKQMYLLKKQLHHLRNLKGNGTELISVYIAAGAPIHMVSNKLKEEAGQASNIKSKGTRKNVTDALERIVHHLKSYGHLAPASGIAIFCGNVSDNPARTDIELFTLLPMQPITVQIYRCDSRFFLEPLDTMLDVKETYGLVVLDGRECIMATLRGTTINVLKKLNSTAHAKIRKGGQSARRYERLIEESIELYYKRIGESMDKYFVSDKIKGVIVGGPGPAKQDFVKMSPFNYQIKLLGVVDTGYSDEYGLREAMDKAKDILAGQQAVKEKELVDRFIKEVVNGSGLAIYGEANVRAAMITKQADVLLVSEGLHWKRYHVKVDGTTEEEWINKRDVDEPPKQLPDGRNVTVLDFHDLLDNLIELADTQGIKVEVVTADTSEGAQFLQSFYGVGAFLRYR